MQFLGSMEKSVSKKQCFVKTIIIITFLSNIDGLVRLQRQSNNNIVNMVVDYTLLKTVEVQSA